MYFQKQVTKPDSKIKSENTLEKVTHVYVGRLLLIWQKYDIRFYFLIKDIWKLFIQTFYLQSCKQTWEWAQNLFSNFIKLFWPTRKVVAITHLLYHADGDDVWKCKIKMNFFYNRIEIVWFDIQLNSQLHR